MQQPAKPKIYYIVHLDRMPSMLSAIKDNVHAWGERKMQFNDDQLTVAYRTL